MADAKNLYLCPHFFTLDMKTAATLVIGDEILIGQTADTNSALIAALLNELGIRIVQMRAVGDNADNICAALADLLRAADLVVITGGLGPTKDDITKAALGKYFGASSMVMHAPTLRNIERLAESGGFEMNDLNRSQALIPDVCEPLPNTAGTAPAMWFERDGRAAVSLPGVPFEMEHILRTELIPRLQARTSRSIVHRTALVFGIAESMLAKQIEQWENSLPQGWHLAYLPTPLGIKLRLSHYHCPSPEAAEREAEGLFGVLKNVIPQYFVGMGNHTLEYFVAQALIEGGYSVSVAESCTGGVIASLLTSMSGSSAYFKGGVAAYHNDVKVGVLGVPQEVIAKYGAVSRETAVHMAEGAVRIMNTDFAAAVTGIAGPSGGLPNKPVGRVWIAVASPSLTAAEGFNFGNKGRQQVVSRAAAMALHLLIRAIRYEKMAVSSKKMPAAANTRATNSQ